jgi:hypothetical protein
MEIGHKAFVEKYNHFVDVVKDGRSFATNLFKSDATFKVGEFPIATTMEAIAGGAEAIYSMTKSLKHETIKIHSITKGSNNDHIYCIIFIHNNYSFEVNFITEGTVTYTLENDQIIGPLSLCSVFELDEETGLIQRYQAYVDLSPLLTAVQIQNK